MKSPAKKQATYQDLYSIPENMVGEILDGNLIVSPRSSPRHTKAASVLGSEIIGPFHKGSGGGPGGWLILIEPELQFGPQTMVPDIAGWKTERLSVYKVLDLMLSSSAIGKQQVEQSAKMADYDFELAS